MSSGGKSFSREVGQAFFGHFSKLRPVQEGAIRSLCAGRNAIVSARAGSGKTEAAVAPLVSRFREKAIRENATVLIYICPTKALINDVARRLKPPLDRLGLNLAIRHGDCNELTGSRVAHVVVTTPESLGILLVQKHSFLNDVAAVVFDEVHLLYNSQRGQMAAILFHRLRKLVNRPIQVAALSATVGRLEDIRTFLLGESTDADLLAFSATREIDGDIRTHPSFRETARLLARLMTAQRRKLLVFANSRHEVEALAAALQSQPGLERAIATHHSSLSKEVREEVEGRFCSAPRAVCVSTSTLEMGIDIGDIDAVVLYGPPFSVESLLQRIGRGNRRTHKTNVICISRDGPGSFRESAVFSTLLSLATGGRMPVQQPFCLFGAVGQQALSVILREQGAFTRIADICDEVGYRSDLNRDSIEGILAELEGHEFIQHHGFKNRYGAADALWALRDKNLLWGNFPLGQQTIDLVYDGRHLGSIPRANLLRLNNGATFRFGGRRYEVAGLVERQIRVIPARGHGAVVRLVFSRGKPTGLDVFIANALWHWLFEVSSEISFMTPENWPRFARFVSEIREASGVDTIPYTDAPTGRRYFTFAGTSTNRVILSWLGIETESADDLTIQTDKPVNWDQTPRSALELMDAAKKSFGPSGRQTIFQQCLPPKLQEREWTESWLKDREVENVLSRLRVSRPVAVPGHLFTPLCQ